MAACTINLKGLVVVAHYDYWSDEENGISDETTVSAVYVLGKDQVVDDSDDKNIIGVLGLSELSNIEAACRKDAIKFNRIGEEP